MCTLNNLSFRSVLKKSIELNEAPKYSIALVLSIVLYHKVSKGAKIRNQYNQVPHLTQDTDGKVAYSQLDTTNESQEISPFPAGDHKAHINRRTSSLIIL